MQCIRLSFIVVAIAMMVALSQAQNLHGMNGPPAHGHGGHGHGHGGHGHGPGAAPPPPPAVSYGYAPAPAGVYPHIQSTQCRYLITAPTHWGANASPFVIRLRSQSQGTIRRGYPVEVTLAPMYRAFKFFNFTDFAVWAEAKVFPPTPNIVNPEMPHALRPPLGPPATETHKGIWQVFQKFAGGATGLHCNPATYNQDTVGSFEERMLELFKTQFPGDNRLRYFHPSARNMAAFLWYPDDDISNRGYSVKFVAKMKSFGQWFKLESAPWQVYRPRPRRPPPRRRFTSATPFDWNTFVENYSKMNAQAIKMERQLEMAENGKAV